VRSEGEHAADGEQEERHDATRYGYREPALVRGVAVGCNLFEVRLGVLSAGTRGVVVQNGIPRSDDATHGARRALITDVRDTHVHPCVVEGHEQGEGE